MRDCIKGSKQKCETKSVQQQIFFSRVFDSKGELAIGLQLFRFKQSAPGFLRGKGIKPDINEERIMLIKLGFHHKQNMGQCDKYSKFMSLTLEGEEKWDSYICGITQRQLLMNITNLSIEKGQKILHCSLQ